MIQHGKKYIHFLEILIFIMNISFKPDLNYSQAAIKLHCVNPTTAILFYGVKNICNFIRKGAKRDCLNYRCRIAGSQDRIRGVCLTHQYINFVKLSIFHSAQKNKIHSPE